MSISYLHHKGKKILLVDYTKCKTTEDTLSVLELVKEEYIRTNEKFISLNDFTGVSPNNEYMEVAQKYGKLYFDSKTLKSACIGITGIKKILLSGYNLTVKNKLVPFDTKNEALDYLSN